MKKSYRNLGKTIQTGRRPLEGPSQKIRLFFDESGDFSSPGHQLIASLCHIDDGNYHNLLRFTENSFKETQKSYRRFHATRMRAKEKKNAFVHLVQRLATKKISVYMNAVALNKKSPFDIYFPLLSSSIIEIIDQLSDTYGKMNLEVFLEDRGKANYKILCDIIREKCLQRKRVVPELRVLNLPKGENAMISLVDLFSNLYFKDLGHGSNLFKNQLKGWNTYFYKQNESFVTSKNARKIFNRITTGKIIKITRITQKITKVVQKKGRTVFVHDNTTASGRIIAEFDYKFRQNQSVNKWDEIFSKAHRKLSKCSRADRLYEVEKLLDVYQGLYETRRFQLSIIFSEFITFHLGNELETKMGGDEKLKWLYIKNISRWLAAQNHLGEFQAEHWTVLKAENFIAAFIEYSDCWSEIASFFTHVSISFQNIFEFEKAAEHIRPHVDYFSNLTHNPFGSENITGRYIGGLFGCFSQALFFYSHCSYYYTKGSQFEDIFEQAMIYSELSEIFFDDHKDIERQYIYRVHGYMQRFILLEDNTALENARDLLFQKFNQDELCKAFFENHKEMSSNDLYAFLAFLKLEWLSKKGSTFLPDIRYIIKKAGELPARHPYEQILGYLILLGVNKSGMPRLMKHKIWHENIIQIIALVFCLQIEWEKNQLLDPDILGEINILINDRLLTPLKRYGIIEQLSDMKRPDYNGIGPISILPYNYA
jgi:hypothetical protein